MEKSKELIEKTKHSISLFDKTAKIPNPFITMSGIPTLSENRLLSLAFVCREGLKEREYDTGSEKIMTLSAKISAEELSYAFGLKDRAQLYNHVKEPSDKLLTRTIGYEDGKGNFIIRNIFAGVDYKNGELMIYFSHLLDKKYFFELQKNYTLCKTDILFSFRSVNSFRLYELIKRMAYGNEDGKYSIYFTLGELKLLLGTVSVTDLKGLIKNPSPDLNEIVEKISKKNNIYVKPNEFKRKCIDTAKKEINEKSDLFIKDVIVERKGKGGKTHGYTFIVVDKSVNSDNSDNKEVIDISYIEEIKDILKDESFKDEEIETIARVAKNLDKVKQGYEVLKAGKDVKKRAAYLVDAIKNNYKAPVKMYFGEVRKKALQGKGTYFYQAGDYLYLDEHEEYSRLTIKIPFEEGRALTEEEKNRLDELNRLESLRKKEAED